MQYRWPSKKTPAEIGRELGVDAIVEGSGVAVGEKVRITARLIQARGDHYLWGETYSREVGDILDLQRDVAQAIANQIRATVVQPAPVHPAVRRTVDPAVHDLVLKGKYHADQLSQATLKQAIGYFEQAIAIDPNYAPAHGGLACAYRSSAF